MCRLLNQSNIVFFLFVAFFLLVRRDFLCSIRWNGLRLSINQNIKCRISICLWRINRTHRHTPTLYIHTHIHSRVHCAYRTSSFGSIHSPHFANQMGILSASLHGHFSYILLQIILFSLNSIFMLRTVKIIHLKY